MDKKIYMIGELAEEFGLTLRALRFYEDKGLVSPTRRRKTRLYSEADRERVAVIILLKEMGYSLSAIKNLAPRGRHPALQDTPNITLEECRTQVAMLESERKSLAITLGKAYRCLDLLDGI